MINFFAEELKSLIFNIWCLKNALIWWHRKLCKCKHSTSNSDLLTAMYNILLKYAIQLSLEIYKFYLIHTPDYDQVRQKLAYSQMLPK